MNKQELRIGNQVLDSHNNVFKIDGFMNDSVFRNVEDERVRFILQNTNELSPIKLNEEILLKLGFTEYGHILKIHLNDGLGINYNSDSKQFYLDINFTTTSKIEIQYLHTLQNLYLSLTSKELAIN